MDLKKYLKKILSLILAFGFSGIYNRKSFDVFLILQKDAEAAGGKDRAQWGNSLEFLMSCIAMSVGLGNIWRFPFTAFENGGGAFLIPYIFTLIVIGRPMYYMEMVLGQFTSKGNVQMFKSLAPGFRGRFL